LRYSETSELQAEPWYITELEPKPNHFMDTEHGPEHNGICLSNGIKVTLHGEDFLTRHCTLFVKISGPPQERGLNFCPPHGRNEFSGHPEQALEVSQWGTMPMEYFLNVGLPPNGTIILRHHLRAKRSRESFHGDRQCKEVSLFF